MSTKQDRIAGLLVRGMKPSMVAQIVACDPSYISQLLKDEDFQYHLEQLKLEAAEETEVVDERKEEALFYTDRLAAAEHQVLDKILHELPYMSGREALGALDVIGKRRDSMQAGMAKQGATTLGLDGLPPGSTVRLVEITVPNICVPELQLAGNREIIAIGDKSVNPMPTAKLKEMLSKVDSDPLEAQYEYHEDLKAAL